MPLKTNTFEAYYLQTGKRVRRFELVTQIAEGIYLYILNIYFLRFRQRVGFGGCYHRGL